eukprot:s2746_g6.t1
MVTTCIGRNPDLDALNDSGGQRFQSIDTKVSIALSSMIQQAGDVARNVAMQLRHRTHAAGRLGGFVMGREILAMVLNHFRTPGVSETMFTMEHIVKMTYFGDAHLDQFYGEWTEMVNNMRPEDVPPDDWLRHALYKKVRHSKLLMYDIKRWESWDEGDERKTYRYLRNVIERAIARVKEDKNAAARDRYAREYAGTGKPGAPAPATPTPKAGQEPPAEPKAKAKPKDKAKVEATPELPSPSPKNHAKGKGKGKGNGTPRKTGASQSPSPKNKKKIPCHFHFVKKACKKGKDCEYSHDQKVFDNQKKKDGKSQSPSSESPTNKPRRLMNHVGTGRKEVANSVTSVEEDMTNISSIPHRALLNHQLHRHWSTTLTVMMTFALPKTTEEIRKGEHWTFDCRIVHRWLYGDLANEIFEENYIEHVPGKFGVKGNVMCITVPVEERDKKFIMGFGSGHDLIARRKVDRLDVETYEDEVNKKTKKRRKKKIVHEVAVGREEDYEGHVEELDDDDDEDEYPPSIAGDAPDVKHGVEVDGAEPGDDDDEDVIDVDEEDGGPRSSRARSFLVFFKPSGARAVEQKRKFDPKGIPGVFAGYELASGLHWSRKYQVWSLTDWTKQSLAYNAGKPIPKLKTPHYTERVEMKEPLESPCKENCEKINVSIEGLKEKDRLEGSPDYLPLPPPGDDEDPDDDDGGDDDRGVGGGDGPDGGKSSAVDPEILAEVQQLEFVGAEEAARRADLPPPPRLDAPAPSSSKPARAEIPEGTPDYFEGTKGDGIIYWNNDGEKVKIDTMGRFYREMEAEAERERSKVDRKIKDAEKASKAKQDKKKAKAEK